METIWSLFSGSTTPAQSSSALKKSIVERIHVELDKESCILRIEYEQGLTTENPSDVHMQLFSMDNGIYSTTYKHANMKEFLGRLKGPNVHASYNEHKSLVTFHLGPHGLLPVELPKNWQYTLDLRIHHLEEQVRRLNDTVSSLCKKVEVLEGDKKMGGSSAC